MSDLSQAPWRLATYEDRPTLADVQPAIWLGYDTAHEAFHHLMDQHYDGEGRNPWVVAEMKSGHYRVMKDSEADDQEEVVNYFTLQFNHDYSTSLISWLTGEEFIRIAEGA